MDAELTGVLDITPPEADILANMRKTTRYEIRHAQKLGVKIVRSSDPKDIIKFLDLYDQTAARHGFVKHLGISEEFSQFTAQNQAVLYFGSYQDKTVAAAFVLYFGEQAIYHHGASLRTKVPVSTLIQWQAIGEAKNRGLKRYNFWGIAPPDKLKHPWQGITLFKKGFGGRPQQYLHAHDLPVSRLYILPRLVELARRQLKGY